HHVAQRTRSLVVCAAPLDADGLGGGYLDVIDIAAVPDRLEDPVAEPEHHHVLDGLFSEVVIDPIDLTLVENALDLLIQRARRIEIVPERLLDNHPAPVVLFLDGQTDGAELLYDLAEERRRRGEIEQVVAGRALFLVDR